MARGGLSLLCGLTLCGHAASAGHGYKSSERWLQRNYVITGPTAEELVDEADLPTDWDWRDVNGQNFVVADWNQHIPQYCGGCWIHGTTSALSDRIKVLRGGQFPDVMLSRQAILNCVPDPTGEGPPPGCEGGDPYMIHDFMVNNSMPDESCMHYQARNMGCSPENICRNCLPTDTVLPGVQGCFPIYNFTGYRVGDHGHIKGEMAMMKEIYARGPIVCSAATDNEFLLNYSLNAEKHEGVYVTNLTYNISQVDHNIEVAGWGVTHSGIKYWVIRNSWGTYWGELGWFKLQRGVDTMRIEKDCNWAVPTWDGLDKALLGKVMGSYVKGTVIVPPTPVQGLRPVGTEAQALSGQPTGDTNLIAGMVGIIGFSLLLIGYLSVRQRNNVFVFGMRSPLLEHPI